jgi:hypothetical protein
MVMAALVARAMMSSRYFASLVSCAV